MVTQAELLVEVHNTIGELRRQPLAGALFAVNVAAIGLPPAEARL